VKSISKDASPIFVDELGKTIRVSVSGGAGRGLYRLEAFRSNFNNNWTISAYRHDAFTGWKPIDKSDFPYIQEKDEETAINTALDFLWKRRNQYETLLGRIVRAIFGR
jgi:hypothetical protein